MHADVGICKKILHFLPVIPVYLIISTVTYAFTYNITFDGDKSSSKLFLVIIFYYFAFMVVLSHSLAMWSNPGKVLITQNVDLENFPSDSSNTHNPLFCKKCNGSRPERSHHCKMCKKCIMRMDHHCPWIANCVGLYNMKYFYLFLFYATLGDFIASVMLYMKFKDMNISDKLKNQKASTILELIVIFKEPLILIIGIMLAIAMTVSIGFLFLLQTKNLLNDTTTLENILDLNKSKKKGSIGLNRLDNFKSIMGDRVYKWLIPYNFVNINEGSKSGIKLQTKDGHRNTNNYISLTDNINEFDDNIHINLNLND